MTDISNCVIKYFVSIIRNSDVGQGQEGREGNWSKFVKNHLSTYNQHNISSLSGEGQRVRGRKLASRAQDKSGVNNHGCREKVITNLNYQVENLNSTAQQQYTEESSPCYI